MLSENVNTYRSIILPVVLYGCETCIYLEGRTQIRAYDWVQRYANIWLKGRKYRENGEKYTVRSFITCTVHQTGLLISVMKSRSTTEYKNVGWKLEERNFGDIDIDGRVEYQSRYQTGYERVYWIQLA
jgi:hypothetical protein